MSEYPLSSPLRILSDGVLASMITLESTVNDVNISVPTIVVTTYDIVLPAAQGTTDQVLKLQNNSGQTYWDTIINNTNLGAGAQLAITGETNSTRSFRSITSTTNQLSVTQSTNTIDLDTIYSGARLRRTAGTQTIPLDTWTTVITLTSSFENNDSTAPSLGTITIGDSGIVCLLGRVTMNSITSLSIDQINPYFALRITMTGGQFPYPTVVSRAYLPQEFGDRITSLDANTIYVHRIAELFSGWTVNLQVYQHVLSTGLATSPNNTNNQEAIEFTIMKFNY